MHRYTAMSCVLLGAACASEDDTRQARESVSRAEDAAEPEERDDMTAPSALTTVSDTSNAQGAGVLDGASTSGPNDPPSEGDAGAPPQDAQADSTYDGSGAKVCADALSTASYYPGSQRCNLIEGSVETCGQDGSWQRNALCPIQSEVCVVLGDTARCVGAQDYFVGNTQVDSSWRVIEASNVMYAQRFTVAEPVTVRALFVNSAVKAGGCDLALYADEQGHPGAWVSSVLSLPIESVPIGRAVNSRTVLQSDTPYWMTANCYQDAAPGQLYEADRADQEAYAVSVPAGVLPPTRFPMEGAVYRAGRAYSIFLQVRSLPPPQP